jgi:molybdate transport system substrate-binding protein
MSLRFIASTIVCLAGLFPIVASPANEPPVLVFAAASLTDAMQEIGSAFTRKTGKRVTLSFAASSALARQIESGGRVDVFVSADREWMDYLETRNLVRPDSRTNVAGNRLVLIAPSDSKLELKLEPHARIAEALGNRRLATGDPDIVPVGRYAKQALTSLDVWDRVSNRLVGADNVRAALAFVARGEAPLGIVYETDARIDPQVRVVAVFPANSHAPIVYPAAATTNAQTAAQTFIDFLLEPEAQAILAKLGFQPAPQQ